MAYARAPGITAVNTTVPRWRPDWARSGRRALLWTAPFIAMPLGSQSVQGRVVDGGTGAPLPGVMVILIDSTGGVQASALSDERGTFTVRGRSPGVYRLRLEAVGYQDESSDVFPLAEGATLLRTVRFEGRARLLPAVTVRARPRCKGTPETAAAAAILWDEIRKALALTQLTVESERYRFDLQEFERELDTGTGATRRSRTWHRAGVVGPPYQSIPAESLAAYGYVRTMADGMWYYAPDARTLLTDAFTATHCLRPVPAGRPGAGLVGLAFDPVPSRTVPDVRGVIWLDAATSHMRYLEYEYTGLPRGIAGHALGGRVAFDRLPSGAWIVSEWRIRMPRITRTSSSMPSAIPDAGPPRLVPVTVDVVAGIIERGADVTARLVTASAVSVPGRTIDGVVRGATGRPVAMAEVTIPDAGIAVRSDTSGRFHIGLLPAGRYVVEARAIGFVPVTRIVDLRDTTAMTLEFRFESPAQLLPAMTRLERRDPYRTGFEDRRAKRTGGHFLTNDEIRRSGLHRVTDLLRRVPGLQVRKAGEVSVMEFTGRGGRTFSSHGCPVAYALDGVPFEPAAFGLDGELSLQDIEAIEVYDAATAPVQYSRRGTACGVILLWTRERSIPATVGDSSPPRPQ